MSKCITCNNQAVEDRVRCSKCLHDARRYAREYIRKKKAAGLCIDCSSPITDGMYCQSCRAKRNDLARNRYYERRSSGLCVECSTPVSGQYLCNDCLRKYRAYRRNGTKSKLYQSVKERDGWKCRICDKTNSLVIHHIDGQGEREPAGRQRQRPNDDSANLITLCRGCHASLTKFINCENGSLVIELLTSVKRVGP